MVYVPHKKCAHQPGADTQHAAKQCSTSSVLEENDGQERRRVNELYDFIYFSWHFPFPVMAWQ